MSWPFLQPVDPKDVPDYYDIVPEPMGKLLVIEQIIEASFIWFDGNIFITVLHKSLFAICHCIDLLSSPCGLELGSKSWTIYGTYDRSQVLPC